MHNPDAAPAVPPYRPLVVDSRFTRRTSIRVLAARLIMEARGSVTCCDWRKVSLGPVTRRFGFRQMELCAGEQTWMIDSFSFPRFDVLRRAIEERIRVGRWASLRALHLMEHEEREAVEALALAAEDERVRVA